MSGSISLLIDSPLKDLAVAMRAVGPETRSQIGAATKASAAPIWREETRGRAASRLQQRVLVNTARVSVTARNVTLLSGGGGKLSSGTPTGDLVKPVEFGASPNAPVRTRSRKGKAYTRRMGTAFGGPRRGGHVVYRAASEAIPRFASLWVQTAYRCAHEAIEKVA